MRIEADLELLGLEEALAAFLPLDGAIKPQRIQIDGDRLRLEFRAPMAGKVALTAAVRSTPGSLELSDFALEGARLFQGVVLGMVRSRVASLDVRNGPFHAWGEAEGERLHLRWDEATGS